MPTVKLPVVIWRDPAGAFTAVPVDSADEDAVGFAATARAARDMLADYLHFAARRRGSLDAPDVLDPTLAEFTVRVRPEYHAGDRVYPCPDAVDVRVACVSGRLRSGLLVASLPLLDARFYYHDAGELPRLVDRYARQELEGKDPAGLGRFLPPAEVRLETLHVRTPRPRKHDGPAAPPEALAAVAEPLGEKAGRRQFGAAWERDREADALARQLADDAASLLLVGEAGCGKTTLLAEAVHRADRRAAQEAKAEGKPAPRGRYWLTTGARLIAGMKYLGQWEERCERVVAELQAVGGVLCVEKLLDLLRTGGRGPGDSVMAFFAPYVRRGELRVVAEATPAELDACRRLLPGCAELFEAVPVPTFDRPRALAVLDRLTAGLGQSRKAETEPGVGERVDTLFRRFQPYRAFPGPAAAFVRSLYDAPARGGRVTVADAVERFRRQTGLPELFLRDEVPVVYEDVLAHFRREVVGQDEACRAAAHLVTTFKAGLNDPARPVGVLLFCGPTGVGKTETARAVARYFFGAGGQDRLVRLDMSEYAGPDAADRLLGPPGGQPSALVRQLREQPFCVVLLDEIEKAGPEVFDVLLGVCDEGRLTDRFGRETTFRSAIVVMTSNLGAATSGGFGFGGTSPQHYLTAVREFFRPEFFNRLDGVVNFRPLGGDAIRAIARGELGRVGRREAFAAAGLTLAWTDRLLAELARAGFDERYGARPLQRTIEQRLVAPLARWLLERPGLRDATVTADLAGGGGAAFAAAARYDAGSPHAAAGEP